MIVDFIYSYTTDVLRDAQAFGDAAGQAQGKVNLADVELAIHSRADMSFAQSPNLEVSSLHRPQRILGRYPAKWIPSEAWQDTNGAGTFR